VVLDSAEMRAGDAGLRDLDGSLPAPFASGPRQPSRQPLGRARFSASTRKELNMRPLIAPALIILAGLAVPAGAGETQAMFAVSVTLYQAYRADPAAFQQYCASGKALDMPEVSVQVTCPSAAEAAVTGPGASGTPMQARRRAPAADHPQIMVTY
jgi:hypothetical protein